MDDSSSGWGCRLVKLHGGIGGAIEYDVVLSRGGRMHTTVSSRTCAGSAAGPSGSSGPSGPKGPAEHLGALRILLLRVFELAKELLEDVERPFPLSEQPSLCRAISRVAAAFALEIEAKSAEVTRATPAPEAAPEAAPRVPGSVTFRTATTVEYPGNWGSNKSTFECPDMASEFFEQQKKVNGSRGLITTSRVLLVEHDGLMYSLGQPVTVVPL